MGRLLAAAATVALLAGCATDPTAAACEQWEAEAEVEDDPYVRALDILEQHGSEDLDPALRRALRDVVDSRSHSDFSTAVAQGVGAVVEVNLACADHLQ